jgi:hypothetical protein
MTDLDDISIKSGPCRKNPGDCNFENSFCSWTNSKRADFVWLLNRGGTLTDGTGPTVDQ